ncbi:MAG: hypothetical protein EOM08_08355 [Clostridia bacterium]|nr:hypothetical protein [Clostridia bacterium]
MVQDLVICRDPAGWPQAVLVEDGQPVEWIRPLPDTTARRQDILEGRIESIDRALGAFIAIGEEENALLPHREVPPGSKPGQTILVQVRRLITSPHPAAATAKGHLVTTRLQYPGLFAVYEPDPERIIRRSKLGLAPAPDQDFLLAGETAWLESVHATVCSAAKAGGPVPRLIWRPRTVCAAALMDWARPDLRSIQCNDIDLFTQLDTLVQEHWPALRPVLTLCPESFDLVAAFRLGNLAQEVNRRQVHLKNGASISFDQTEALLVIDVNTKKAQARDPEDLSVKTNLLAAVEIARQLRLRNQAGIVVVDFIRLHSAEDRAELVRFFSSELKKDRGKITLGGLTRLGLFELVRQVP